MQPMTAKEQEFHQETVKTIRSVLSALRLTAVTDEDIRVAQARLENWLTENDERWVK